MTYAAYKQLFKDILEQPHPPKPYDNEMYLQYTKLNQSRMNRWDKRLELSPELVKKIKGITTPQHWIIITEPWCGDAAHLVPFFIAMTALNSLITYDIQLRDSEPFLINSYLTNGSKSIPKLVVKDAEAKDVLVWGARPEGAQAVMENLQAQQADFETIKVALQKWYNEDKGTAVSAEIEALL